MWTIWILLSVICGALHGAVHTASHIECGQSTVGIVFKGQIVSFEFTMEQQEDVQFVDTNNSFVPILKIKDSDNRYIDGGFTTNFEQKDCEGTVFTVTALPRGVYTVQMIAEDDGDFKVDMMCSIDDRGGMALFQGTQSISATFRDPNCCVFESSSSEIVCVHDMVLRMMSMYPY